MVIAVFGPKWQFLTVLGPKREIFRENNFLAIFFKTQNWLSMWKIRQILWLDLEKLVKIDIFFDRFWVKKGKLRFFGKILFWPFSLRPTTEFLWEKSERSHDWIWRNWSKWTFLGQNGHFWPFLGQNGENGIFCQNTKMSLPYTHEAATLCKQLEKSYERILRSNANVRTNGREWIHRSQIRFAGDQKKHQRKPKNAKNNKRTTENMFLVV